MRDTEFFYEGPYAGTRPGGDEFGTVMIGFKKLNTMTFEVTPKRSPRIIEGLGQVTEPGKYTLFTDGFGKFYSLHYWGRSIIDAA